MVGPGQQYMGLLAPHKTAKPVTCAQQPCGPTLWARHPGRYTGTERVHLHLFGQLVLKIAIIGDHGYGDVVSRGLKAIGKRYNPPLGAAGLESINKNQNPHNSYSHSAIQVNIKAASIRKGNSALYLS
jgi:hypothetical protein